jgi:hypothetical protein
VGRPDRKYTSRKLLRKWVALRLPWAGIWVV